MFELSFYDWNTSFCKLNVIKLVIPVALLDGYRYNGFELV